MKTFWDDEKGNAYAWIAGLAGLFIISLAYLTMTPAVEQVYNVTASNTTLFQYNETRTVIQTAWSTWPILLLLAVALWVIVQALRRDQYGGTF